MIYTHTHKHTHTHTHTQTQTQTQTHTPQFEDFSEQIEQKRRGKRIGLQVGHKSLFTSMPVELTLAKELEEAAAPLFVAPCDGCSDERR